MAKSTFILLSLMVFLTSCKKESTPKSTQGYFFDYNVRMKSKQEEPTIINGYWGFVKEYKGDFMPVLGGEAKQPKIATNKILFFEADWKDEIEETAVDKNGVKLYDLAQIRKKEIAPKFVLSPNRKGFYQFDPNGKTYVGLIQVSKNLGYMNGGLQIFGNLNNELINYTMRIDYQATF